MTDKKESPLKINKDRLREWSACASGYAWFLERLPYGGMFSEVYRALRDDRRYKDGDWLVDRVLSKLDAGEKVAQLVSITGADKEKIEQQVKECGAATTGSCANAATTGSWANAATTGYRANAATTGYQANAATTGYRANAATTGEHSVAAALGIKGKAKAGLGGAIVLCYRKYDGSLVHIRASKVGENGIKPDVWYSLDEHNKFAEWIE